MILIITAIFIIFLLGLTIYSIFFNITVNRIKNILWVILLFITFIWIYFSIWSWNIINQTINIFVSIITLLLLMWFIVTVLELNENYNLIENNKKKLENIETLDDIKNKNTLLFVRIISLIIINVLILVFF